MTQEQWQSAVVDGSAKCYFKATNELHESGYNCFEVGYCLASSGDMYDKLVLGTYSDSINTSFTKAPSLMMDCLPDGSIRVWSFGGILWWESWDSVVSTASLVFYNK